MGICCYSGFAVLARGTGFMTFDKKSYDLTGASCQYLLARDFLNKDFAIAVHFQDASGAPYKRSIIFADEEDQVEIKPTV